MTELGKCSSGLNGTGLPLSSSFESHGIRGFENEAKKKTRLIRLRAVDGYASDITR